MAAQSELETGKKERKDLEEERSQLLLKIQAMSSENEALKKEAETKEERLSLEMRNLKSEVESWKAKEMQSSEDRDDQARKSAEVYFCPPKIFGLPEHPKKLMEKHVFDPRKFLVFRGVTKWLRAPRERKFQYRALDKLCHRAAIFYINFKFILVGNEIPARIKEE